MFLTRILCFNFPGAPCCIPGVTPTLASSLPAFHTTNWHLCAALGQPTKPGFLEQHTHLGTITALANCSLHSSAAALSTWWHPQFRTPGRTHTRQDRSMLSSLCYLISGLLSSLEAATCISISVSQKKKKTYHKSQKALLTNSSMNSCIYFNMVFPDFSRV